MIKQPDSVVFDYLRVFKNHKAFNAWFMKDPNMKETTKNIDGEPGFILRFEGNKNLGTGEEELIGLVPNKEIDIELRFLKPVKSTSRTPFTLERTGNKETKVRWTMNGKMSYPMNFALLFLEMDKFLGNDVQKSLDNLKITLEKEI
ncbi:polyketide cyclase [bacterium]|nr:polyketide cyclase [bacterium]